MSSSYFKLAARGRIFGLAVQSAVRRKNSYSFGATFYNHYHIVTRVRLRSKSTIDGINSNRICHPCRHTYSVIHITKRLVHG